MTDYTELKRLAEAHAQKDIADPIESKRVMLVEPAVVLALITENEGLHAQHARDSGELRKLCAARDSARRERDQLNAEVDSLTREADRQYTTIEAYRKDAERYQWLREADWWRSPVCVIRNPKEQAKLGSDCPSGERLDEAVDAAMGKGEQS